MPVHSLLVESVDLRRLAVRRRNDVFRDHLDRRPETPVRKSVAPSRAKARATALPIAPPPP